MKRMSSKHQRNSVGRPAGRANLKGQSCTGGYTRARVLAVQHLCCRALWCPPSTVIVFPPLPLSLILCCLKVLFWHFWVIIISNIVSKGETDSPEVERLVLSVLQVSVWGICVPSGVWRRPWGCRRRARPGRLAAGVWICGLLSFFVSLGWDRLDSASWAWRPGQVGRGRAQPSPPGFSGRPEPCALCPRVGGPPAP